MSWQQTLDRLAGYIRRLEDDLAHADALIATHAYKIDPSPPDTWPAGSSLQAAIGRHAVRCAEESLARATETARRRGVSLPNGERT